MTQVTYVRPAVRVSGWRDIDTGQALAEVFRRFLRAYGPATHRDFAQWFDVTPAGVEHVHRRVSHPGFEPGTKGLKGPCSAVELVARAHRVYAAPGSSPFAMNAINASSASSP